MDSVANASPFPFFKLPAELRNIIYRFVGITGRSLIVEDMHRKRFEKSQKNGTYQARSTYFTKDHVCKRSKYTSMCELKCIGARPIRTTYKIGNPDSIDTTATAMLSLNKESRDEVASLFYGENTFHFVTMSSLLPFMKDRTVETRKYIQRLRLTLIIDYRTWNPVCTAEGTSAAWSSAFSALGKLPPLNIKTLCVTLDDRGSMLVRGLDLRSRTLHWLRNLTNFKDLDKLGVRHDVKILDRYEANTWKYLGRQANHQRQSLNIHEEPDDLTEGELWRILAPKMLKKKADDHSPDALLDRRIWDFSTWQ